MCTVGGWVESSGGAGLSEHGPVWSHRCGLDDLVVPYAIEARAAERLDRPSWVVAAVDGDVEVGAGRGDLPGPGDGGGAGRADGAGAPVLLAA